MSVDCSSVVAYGHILTEEEYYLLEEKFGEYLYEKLEECNEDYSCHLICRNSYTDKKHQNFMLGDEVIYVSDGCFAPVMNCLGDKSLEKDKRYYERIACRKNSVLFTSHLCDNLSAVHSP